MQAFLRALEIQRWDDHRFYHHSRINQSLHLLSALSFIAAYVAMFKDPAIAALIGWLVAMVSRQVGHFFFEPKGFDTVNQMSHEYKESIKVGYNLRRKVVLLSIWGLSPAALWLSPSLWGLLHRPVTALEWLRNIGQIWLVVGFGGLLFRTLQLIFLKDLQTGVVWLTKIITDPFHDIMLYYRAPWYLLKGELFDPVVPPCERTASPIAGDA